MKHTRKLIMLALSISLVFACKTSVDDPHPDFVQVNGGTYDGKIALNPSSEVFIEGRSITINDLWVGTHQVTQREYEQYCYYGYEGPTEEFGVGENIPAYGVFWYDAIVYCNLRSMEEKLNPVYSLNDETDPRKWEYVQTKTENQVTKYKSPDYEDLGSAEYDTAMNLWSTVSMDITANGYRLPTEAEWEYIARGCNKDSYLYSGSNVLSDVAWCEENYEDRVHEVSRKTPNSLGIYDMSGNGSEWCWDFYDYNNTKIEIDTPVTGLTTGTSRCCRSGWGEEECRVNHRSGASTDDDLSFRVVRTLPNK